MMRLIDADALMKEFEIRQKRQINEYCDCFLNDAQNLSTEWYCVEDIVEAAPTIEAEPVVHCKDCLHRMKIPDDRKHYFIEGCFWCALWRGNPTFDISVVMPDDYCSAGVAEEKRKKSGRKDGFGGVRGAAD